MKRCPAKLGRLLVANKLDAATRNKIQKQTFERRAACVTLGSLLTFVAYAHRKKLGRNPERPLSSSSPFSSRSQRMSAIRP
jgi:hypothetical protein